ncbi:MAG: hypothetical protein ABI277_01550 [Burkholderiaceae bacterium]
MNHFIRTAAFRTSALAACLASTLALAGPTGVPFKASLTTQEAIHLDPVACQSAPFLAGVTTASGQASHLGAVTGSGTDCITPTSAYTYMFSNGKLSMIAANGDELRADYSGNLSPSATPPVFVINGTYRITGGTGRFANASGTGAVGGLENLETGQGQLALKGSISY